MARRKRLSPATALSDAPDGAQEVKSDRKPIASIVADVAGRVELIEAVQEHSVARADGRLVALLPVEAIEAGHLVHDRMMADDAELAALKASIAARGQQTRIEVEDLGMGAMARFRAGGGWKHCAPFRPMWTTAISGKAGRLSER
jgi:ParB family chromosome partitioning protein